MGKVDVVRVQYWVSLCLLGLIVHRSHRLSAPRPCGSPSALARGSLPFHSLFGRSRPLTDRSRLRLALCPCQSLRASFSVGARWPSGSLAPTAPVALSRPGVVLAPWGSRSRCPGGFLGPGVLGVPRCDGASPRPHSRSRGPCVLCVSGVPCLPLWCGARRAPLTPYCTTPPVPPQGASNSGRVISRACSLGKLTTSYHTLGIIHQDHAMGPSFLFPASSTPLEYPLAPRPTPCYLLPYDKHPRPLYRPLRPGSFTTPPFSRVPGQAFLPLVLGRGLRRRSTPYHRRALFAAARPLPPCGVRAVPVPPPPA